MATQNVSLAYHYPWRQSSRLPPSISRSPFCCTCSVTTMECSDIILQRLFSPCTSLWQILHWVRRSWTGSCHVCMLYYTCLRKMTAGMNLDRDTLGTQLVAPWRKMLLLFSAECTFIVVGEKRFMKVQQFFLFLNVFQIYPDRELETQVLSLSIRCIHSEEGCRWSGQLKQLQVRGLVIPGGNYYWVHSVKQKARLPLLLQFVLLDWESLWQVSVWTWFFETTFRGINHKLAAVTAKMFLWRVCYTSSPVMV